MNTGNFVIACCFSWNRRLRFLHAPLLEREGFSVPMQISLLIETTVLFGSANQYPGGGPRSFC